MRLLVQRLSYLYINKLQLQLSFFKLKKLNYKFFTTLHKVFIVEQRFQRNCQTYPQYMTHLSFYIRVLLVIPGSTPSLESTQANFDSLCHTHVELISFDQSKRL